MERYIASELLAAAVEQHEIHLSLLVADTSLWANPAVHKRILEETGGVAMSPHVRRARAGEQQGEVVEGVRLDSNNYANVAIKRAVGLHRTRVEGFEACHIWPLTCYDARYHTAIANLVLLPRALAGLSDHDEEIQQALQYRAFELYEWWPEEFDAPSRPRFYPDSWREPLPDPVRAGGGSARRFSTNGSQVVELEADEVELLSARLVRWSEKPDLLVHKAVGLIVESGEGLPRGDWVDRVAALTGSPNAYGATAQLFTKASNGYGRVLYDAGGTIRINPALEDVAASLPWRTG